MTKVAMIFEKEKEEAVMAERRKTEAAEKGQARAERGKVRAERGKARAEREKTKAQKALQGLILSLIKGGEMPLEKIAEYSGMDINAVAELARNIS